jgi:hypothetical protein
MTWAVPGFFRVVPGYKASQVRAQGGTLMQHALFITVNPTRRHLLLSSLRAVWLW